MNTPSVQPPRYRPNVAAILQRDDGRILICERITRAGAWQFPQGGISHGEIASEAIVRELEEELSLKPGDYTLLHFKGPYRYLFEKGKPPGHFQKKGFDGQEQTYFLARCAVGFDEKKINVQTLHPEFCRTRWIFPSEFDLNWLPAFKRQVYRAVLFDFFGVCFGV